MEGGISPGNTPGTVNRRVQISVICYQFSYWLNGQLAVIIAILRLMCFLRPAFRIQDRMVRDVA